MAATLTALSDPNPFQGEPYHPYRETVVPFTAADGMELNLVHIRGPEDPTREPVIVVHGAGVRANLFRAPNEVTIVDALIAAGHDVFLENWRASIDLPRNEWSLDAAAVNDHPKAVEKICEVTGHDTIKAVIHCQGSTSFMMSAVAGLVPQVTDVVSNAVSLHPVLSGPCGIKINYVVPVVAKVIKYLDCSWGLEAKGVRAKVITAFVKLTHRECSNTVCRLSSFSYGYGFPAMWSHENLSDRTHDWLQYELAAVPMGFFLQMKKCAKNGSLVSVDARPELPKDFAAQPPKTDARFSFFAGRNNWVFEWQSQQNTFDWFEKQAPGKHALHLFDNYGHLDMFMGKNAGQDIFPTMIAELNHTQSDPALRTRSAAG